MAMGKHEKARKKRLRKSIFATKLCPRGHFSVTAALTGWLPFSTPVSPPGKSNSHECRAFVKCSDNLYRYRLSADVALHLAEF